MLGRLLTAPIRFVFWAFFPPSTRDRSIRLSFLIVLMFGLAFAALAFKHINIDLPGGAGLQREGTGPLGLKLGLDLRGGGQLIYQADTGTRLRPDLPGAHQPGISRAGPAVPQFR